MKKILSLCICLTTLACGKAELLPDDVPPQTETQDPEEPLQTGDTTSLQISLENTTKTLLGGQLESHYQILWNEGDCVSVNSIGSAALDISQKGSSTAIFKVKGVKAPYSVIYPVTAGFGEGILLPKNQKFTEYGFDPATAIQIAKSSSRNMNLQNVCSYLRITVNRKDSEVIKQIKVISNDNKYLSGRFLIDYENCALNYLEGGLNCVFMGLRPEHDNEKDPESEKTIPYNPIGKCNAFVAIPPGNYPSGFTIIVTATSGDNTVNTAYTNGVTMTSGGVYPVNEINFGDNTFRFSGGSGSEQDPYLIATSDDIVSFFSFSNHDTYSVNYSNKHFKQICDISVENKTMVSAFREPSKAFTGVYDGDGHMLEYLTVTTWAAHPEYASGFIAYAQNATIRNLNIRFRFWRTNPQMLTGNYNGGIVGHMTGGLIENCTLSGNQHAASPYVGGIVGYLDGGIISNCNVASSVSGDGIVTEGDYNNSYVGGVAGCVKTGKILACTLTGRVRSVGSCAGGIVGQILDGEISDCKVERGYIYGDSAQVGGIAGSVKGAGCTIRNCTNDGIVFSKAGEVGGIAGYVSGGKIQSCQVIKPATITGEGSNVGGVAGNIHSSQSSDAVHIDNCSVFASVSGTFNAGGIAGNVTSQGGEMKIINNAYGYNTISTSKSEANMGGIVGIVASNSNVPAQVVNNVCKGAMLENSASGAEVSNLGGIVGNFSGPGDLAWCWSDLMIGNIKVSANDMTYAGSIVGKCSLSTLPHCYYNVNSTIKATTTSGKTGLGSPIASFSDGTLLSRLNWSKGDFVGLNQWTDTQWKESGISYPVPAGVASNTGQSQNTTKRISVIGDSISSFDGYIPEGYTAYYPTATCRTFCVRDMYWYRLAYDYMKDAILDVNLSFSGSHVTNNGYAGSNHFPKRFIERGGMGNPDIILLFGGTNDYTGDRLLYGSKTCKSATAALTDTELKTVFDKADAITTLSKAEEMNDMTFFESYVKLVKMMVLKYPNVKIVLIIGDHFSVGMQETIYSIAEHFNNCRVVDLLKVNGFDSVTDNPDWCAIMKCLPLDLHPNEAGMQFIANKIYTELGSWLESN